MEKRIEEIARWYDIQTEVWRAERRFEETNEALKQHTWEMRETARKEKQYPGSLKKMLDKLKGKGDRTEELQRQAREAKERFEMTALNWNLQSARSVKLQEQRQALPTLESLKDSAREDSEALKYLAQREVQLCAEMLQALLEETDAALEEYRQQLRGEKKRTIASAQEVQAIGTAHIAPARQCAEMMERMKEAMEILGKEWKIHKYFSNPAGFIVSAAAQHNRLDRVSQALSHVAAVRKQIAKL